MNQMEISENLFSAIDIIIDKKLESLRANRTIKVKILSDLAGDYSLTIDYQHQQFKAYSFLNYNFKVGELAYALVPNGKISENIILIGPVEPTPSLSNKTRED